MYITTRMADVDGGRTSITRSFLWQQPDHPDVAEIVRQGMQFDDCRRRGRDPGDLRGVAVPGNELTRCATEDRARELMRAAIAPYT